MSLNSLTNPRQYFSFSERFICNANFDVKKKKPKVTFSQPKFNYFMISHWKD